MDPMPWRSVCQVRCFENSACARFGASDADERAGPGWVGSCAPYGKCGEVRRASDRHRLHTCCRPTAQVAILRHASQSASQ